ncbi:DUF5009 domain-containing protein [Arenibacter sp. 6A1]|uniref:acyltransferase family protein n=1 Tax=Arenibacter sp. 6A1 TaxID=2720391 RepID=UPI001444ED1E|nr:DUF5009 domain-containing protein [Arenibacter sp. 6A1]NKI27934.1 DUF5009 domain-containing protein [Arenibacter sp. 6A1]
MTKTTQTTTALSKRLLSLDVFRGLIMFLLIAEAAGFHHSIGNLAKEFNFIQPFAKQLQHHSWNGLRFWDLIQPYFMFIVGVAMPFSLRKRMARDSKQQVRAHIVKRCLLLFGFGVLLHCVYSHALVWELWNVLVQLAFTITIAFIIMDKSAAWQIYFCVGILLLTEILYRTYNPQDPFVQGENFGSYMDMILMGKINGGGWVTINFLPTAVHTIMGVLCGQLLLSNSTSSKNIKLLLVWGAILLVLGYGMDIVGVTPIIKRIATTSFTLASGGWALLTLALFYWWIEVKNNKNEWLSIFSVVGTNAIFIYLFAETVGVQWFRKFGLIFTQGILSPMGVGEVIIMVINSLFVLFIFWYLTYFLNKKKIYFKI